MTVASAPAARHREVAAAFTARVEGTTDWSAPAPVDGWTARDVVEHLVGWSSGFLAGGAGVELTAGPAAADDPVGAWKVHCAAVQDVLDDPAGRVLSNPYTGEMLVDVAIDRFYTTDVFMHTWDLARATGQDDRLDAEHCAELFAGMEPLDEMLRESGQYGPRVPVAPDADAQTRLLGFIGRDPDWRPAGR